MTTLDDEAPRGGGARARADARRAHVVSELEQGLSLRAVVGLSLFAGLLARGLAPALPGLAVGMAGWITITARTAAIFSLVTVAGALSAAVRLTARRFADGSLDPAYRLLVIPASVCVGVLAVAAVFQSLGAELNLVLAVTAAGAVLVSAPLALRRANSRGAGLALALTGIAGLLHVLGRAIAAHAAEEANVSRFRFAQGTETLASVVDVAMLLFVAVYLWRRSERPARIALAGAALLALALALAATKGIEPNAAWWQVLSGRVIEQFLRAPDPFLPQTLRYLIEIVALALATAALLSKAALGGVGVLLAACLVGRGAADIPIPALILLLSALVGPEIAAGGAARLELSSR